MLQLDQAVISFGIRRWSFNDTLDTHGVYALLGRSGSGKSTLLNLIAGFLKPEHGQILWENQTLNDLTPAQRPATTLFQQHNLFDHLTVSQNIGLGIDPGLKLSKQHHQAISRVLADVGLSGSEARKPGMLSGGEQQRVALARCLLRERPILLLDEPFSALDATTRREMIELLKQVIDNYKPCVLMVTHDDEDAVAMRAEVLRMQDDQLVRDI